MIRVKQPTLLDYEEINMLNFTIVAREMVQEKPKESRANIQVHIRDVNDNPPEFQTDSIEVFVAENVGPGSTLAWIRAEDKDSGILGKGPFKFYVSMFLVFLGPTTYVSINSTVNQQKLPFSDPNHPILS